MLYRYIHKKVQNGQAGSVRKLIVVLALIGVALFVLAFIGWYNFVPVKQALAAENAEALRAQLFTGIFMDRSVLPASLSKTSAFGFTCAMLMRELLIGASVFFALSALAAVEKSLAVKQENGSLWETVRNTAIEYFQQPKWGLQLFSDIMKIVLMLAFVFPFYWMIITAFKTYLTCIVITVVRSETSDCFSCFFISKRIGKCRFKLSGFNSFYVKSFFLKCSDHISHQWSVWI